MAILILGLILFLGIHSINILAPDIRQAGVRSLGVGMWKAFYSLIALVGLVMIIWGYGEVRYTPTWVWTPPFWTRHITALLLIPSFILLVAAYIPGTHMKARLGHPMVLGVKTWAFAHLISNGTIADILLFGGFLAWSVLYYALARRRDRTEGIKPEVAGASRDWIAVVMGLVLYGAFGFVLHDWLIGVRPFG